MTILLAHYDKIKQLNYIQRRTSATSHRSGMPQRFLVVLQNKKPVPPRHVRNSLWRPSASDKAGRQLIPQLPGPWNQLNKRRGTTRPAPSRPPVTPDARHHAQCARRNAPMPHTMTTPTDRPLTRKPKMDTQLLLLLIDCDFDLAHTFSPQNCNQSQTKELKHDILLSLSSSSQREGNSRTLLTLPA